VALCAALVLLGLAGHLLADARASLPDLIAPSAKEHRHLNPHAGVDDLGDAALPNLCPASIEPTAISLLSNSSLKLG